MGRHISHSTDKHKYKVFKQLYNDWTVIAVMKRLEITKENYKKFFDRAVMENLKEPNKPISFNIYAKEAFSENEEDYGTRQWPMKLINIPIENHEPSELTVAVKTYKLLFKKEKYETNVEYADEA